MGDGKVKSSSENQIADEEMLWHFTRIGALSSILSEGLRVTHSACLSDKLDGVLRNRTQKMFADLVAAYHRAEGQVQISEDTENKYRDMLKCDAASPAFIACFAVNPDFEKMWERYCLHGGLAIGVKRACVEKQVAKTEHEEVLVKICDYEGWESRSLRRLIYSSGDEVTVAVAVYGWLNLQRGEKIQKRFGDCPRRDGR